VGNKGKGVSLRDKDRVWRAIETGGDVGAEIVHRTCEVCAAHKDVGEEEAHQDCADPCSNEAFNSLLWRQLDELCLSKGNSTDVCENVVDDDQTDREEEPDHSLKDVVHDEMSLDDNEVESHVCPCELGELELVVSFLEGAHKEDEAHNIEHEADESMVRSEWQQHTIDQHNMLEVVNDAFSIEKVHGGTQEIPVQGLGKAQ